MDAEGSVVLPGVVPDVLMDNVLSDARSRLKDRGALALALALVSSGMATAAVVYHQGAVVV